MYDFNQAGSVFIEPFFVNDYFCLKHRVSLKSCAFTQIKTLTRQSDNVSYLFIKLKPTSFSLNCQSLKWGKTQYAYSELLAVELISSSSNASSYCCAPSSPSWYPRIHPIKTSIQMLHGHSKAFCRYTT